jgi:hypothetical protein
MFHILCIDGIGETFAKRQIVDAIEQIGLPHPVVSDKAIDFGREREVGLLNIFVIQDGKMCYLHIISVALFCFPKLRIFIESYRYCISKKRMPHGHPSSLLTGTNTGR